MGSRYRAYADVGPAPGMQELAAGPPKPFKLSETVGDTHITLTRQYKDEEVSVDLMVNNQVRN
jgi:hypothetical protein